MTHFRFPKWLKQAAVASAISTLLAANSATAAGLNLTGTLFDRVGQESQLDPHLLYSVALAESARGGNQGIAPSPWTLRVADQPGYYANSREEAVARLRELQASYRSIDIGLMQVNTRWNGHRVSDVETLLDPETGLRVGATILQEAINSSPGDLALGIGRYYTWSDDVAARRYGERVLHIYNNIR